MLRLVFSQRTVNRGCLHPAAGFALPEVAWVFWFVFRVVVVFLVFFFGWFCFSGLVWFGFLLEFETGKNGALSSVIL